MGMFFEIEGKRRIAFPDPALGLEENKRLLSNQFPMLRNTTVYAEDGEADGNDMVYPIYLPPAKTNG